MLKKEEEAISPSLATTGSTVPWKMRMTRRCWRLPSRGGCMTFRFQWFFLTKKIEETINRLTLCLVVAAVVAAVVVVVVVASSPSPPSSSSSAAAAVAITTTAAVVPVEVVAPVVVATVVVAIFVVVFAAAAAAAFVLLYSRHLTSFACLTVGRPAPRRRLRLPLQPRAWSRAHPRRLREGRRKGAQDAVQRREQ